MSVPPESAGISTDTRPVSETDATTALVIGSGYGITAGALALYDGIERVEELIGYVGLPDPDADASTLSSKTVWVLR